jgi:cytochrome c-type biogenesis protein CcmH
MKRLLLIWICALLIAAPAYAVGVDGDILPDPAQEAQAREIMRDLRCLVCQNQSIEDSDADLAKDLRHVVRERLKAGDTPEQVKAYMVDRYGDWVLLTPPLKPGTIILWATPLLLLIAGGGALWAIRRKPAAADPLSPEEQAALAKLTDEARS